MHWDSEGHWRELKQSQHRWEHSRSSTSQRFSVTAGSRNSCPQTWPSINHTGDVPLILFPLVELIHLRLQPLWWPVMSGSSGLCSQPGQDRMIMLGEKYLLFCVLYSQINQLCWSVLYSCTLLYMGNTFQDSQGMPETIDCIKPYIYILYYFLCIYSYDSV